MRDGTGVKLPHLNSMLNSRDKRDVENWSRGGLGTTWKGDSQLILIVLLLIRAYRPYIYRLLSSYTAVPYGRNCPLTDETVSYGREGLIAVTTK